MVQYNYYHTFEEFITPTDVQIAFYAVDFDLWFGAIHSFFDFRSVVPCSLYATLLWCTKENTRFSLRQFFIVPFLLIFVGSIIYFSCGSYHYLAKMANSSFIAFHNVISVWEIDFFRQNSFKEREQVDKIEYNNPTKNIVFIMDESVRGDHLSINGYHRKTTPFLDKIQQDGALINWGICSSAATNSINSNNLLLVGVNSFPDTAYHSLTKPTLFQYSKAMGYTNWYFDAQKDIWWNGTRNDFNAIDIWKPMNVIRKNTDIPHYENDKMMAEQVNEIVSSSTGNFIWLTKRGVHHPYNDDFPNERPEWSPIMESNTIDITKQNQLNNSYDDAILYNFETFFKALFKDNIIPQNTIFVYTSDHGQTLSENGENWTHSRVTKNEANVPLFIIGLKTSLHSMFQFLKF